MKIKQVEKLVTNLYDKTEYMIYIGNLKQILYLGLVLEKNHRVIKFNQNAWIKPYIEKDFFKLMNNAVFVKTMENVRKPRNIKLVVTERRKNYLVSEPSYHTTKFIAENLLAIEIRKTLILMNKPIY